MKKLFVSQPMRDLSKESIMRVRENALEYINSIFNDNYELIDSYFDDNVSEPEGVNVGLYWLSKSLELMSQADLIYFASGWEDARGCVIENEAAIKYGIPRIENTYISYNNVNLHDYYPGY